jgi:flagellar basal body-associated protein FliL
MNFDDAKKIYESGRKQPIKTILTVVLLLVLLAISAYVTIFSGEKAKQHANTSTQPVKVNGQGEKIFQTTEGNQSPAIVSDEDVNIEYGGDK